MSRIPLKQWKYSILRRYVGVCCTLLVLCLIGQPLFAQNTTSSMIWTEMNKNISGVVQAVAVQDTLLYIGTSNGIAVSRDYGKTWKTLNNGLDNHDVRCLLVVGNTLYAGTGGAGAAGLSKSGVYCSTNNGVSWRFIGHSNPYYDTFTLNLVQNRLYAGTFLGGLMSTADTGKTWIFHNSGLDKGLPIVRAFEVLGSVWNLGLGQGPHFSADSGKTWFTSSINNFRVSQIISVGATLYTTTQFGVYRSADSGKTWAHSPLSDGWTYAVTSIIRNTDTLLLVGAPQGVFRSKHGENTWQTLTTSIHGGSYWSKFVTQFTPQGDTLLYLSADEGLYQTKNFGDTWEKVSTGILPGVRDFSVNGRQIIAALSNELVVSLDNGKTLQPKTITAQTPETVTKTCIIPSFHSSLPPTWLVGTERGTLYLSRSLGEQWSPVTTLTQSFSASERVTALYCTQTSAKQVWLVGTAGGTIQRSEDAGITWTTYREPALPPAALVAFIELNNVLFAATKDYLLISDDDGISWRKSKAVLRNISALASQSGVKPVLFIGSGSTLWQSVDQGTTFSPVSAPWTKPIITLFHTGRELLCSSSEQVFIRTEPDTTWRLLQQGLPVLSMVQHFQQNTDGVLIAGTANNGLLSLRPNGSEGGVEVLSDNTFVPPRNIDYHHYSSQTISSAADTLSLEFQRWIIRDAGMDGLSATLRTVVVECSASTALRAAALVAYPDSLVISTGTIHKGVLQFQDFQFVIPDGHQKTLALRLSFAAPVQDNTTIQCTLASISFLPSGSVLPAVFTPLPFLRRSDEDYILRVQADRLRVTFPRDVVYAGVPWIFRVEATDEAGSRDVDATAFVSVRETSASGYFTCPSGTQRRLSNGFHEWNDAVISRGGLYRLIAESPGYRSIRSPQLGVLGALSADRASDEPLMTHDPSNVHLQVIPNPVGSESCTIRWIAAQTAMFQLTITSLFGIIVVNHVIPCHQTGLYSYDVDTTTLPSGHYIVRLISGAHSEFQMLHKVR